MKKKCMVIIYIYIYIYIYILVQVQVMFCQTGEKLYLNQRWPHKGHVVPGLCECKTGSRLVSNGLIYIILTFYHLQTQQSPPTCNSLFYRYSSVLCVMTGPCGRLSVSIGDRCVAPVRKTQAGIAGENYKKKLLTAILGLPIAFDVYTMYDWSGNVSMCVVEWFHL